MKMRTALTILVVMALVLPMGLAAAAKQLPSAQLVYFENNSRQLKVTDELGSPATAKEGMKLGVGWTVKTSKGDIAEVELTHNKTIIKISQNTTFTVKALGDTKANPNVLAVAAGKIRTVAGKATGNERYRIEGGAAVCGVSGTDFIFTVPEDGSDAILQTLEGLVEFWKENDPGNILQVGAKMAASFQQFVISQIPDDVWNNLPEDNKFQKLDPKTVPGSAAGKAFEEIMAKVMKILGVEIGAITMYDPLSGENVTWSKVVAQPNFKIGPVKAGLYLPLIYNGNMFEPDDWYHPNGNDEWSFGFDQPTKWLFAVDLVSDVFLKIKYFEWNDNRDPFFFKIGNLNDITVGHGLIMRDFANDADFPAIRRTGLNFGLDFGKVGFEYMVNDVGNLLTLPVMFSDASFVPDVLTGGRLYLQPFDDGEKHDVKSIKDLAFGVSLLADFGPAVDFYEGSITPENAGKPVFLNPGVDIDVPIFETDFFSIVGFADAALMLPYLRSDADPDGIPSSGDEVPQGFRTEAIWNSAADVKFKNYGIAAGMFGNVWFIDWRLEYRYYTGVFKPAFYNTGYERSRSEYVSEVLAYLGDTADPLYDTLTMGVYGEGGFNWKEIAQLDIGYFWPWDASGTLGPEDMEDRLIVKFTFQEIPVIHVSGSFSYERTGFAQALMETGDGSLFDADTVVQAELAYPLVKNMLDVVLFYTMTPYVDPATGALKYDGSWLPEMRTNLTIETRVSY
jgi:hypothetical protein